MFNPAIFIEIVGIIWLIRTLKAVLFWLYLWQLKEYHIGRFKDHFTTHKGKKLLINPLFLIKILLLGFLLFRPETFWILLSIYFIESTLFVGAAARKDIKKPKLTLKTLLLITVSLIITVVYLVTFPNNIVALLIFDIAVPLIVSLIVLLIQPLFVVMRLRILKQATEKIKQHGSLKVIGITGSYGKTSTKEFLTTILSSKFKVLATPEHKNSEMGIAQTILNDLRPDHQVFIVEMGAYDKGGIKLLCDMVHPGLGIVTGVNEQHLATFGSLDNLLSAEGGRELAAALQAAHGMLIVNGENKHCADLYNQFTGNKRIYTSKANTIGGDLWAEDVQATKNYVDFAVVTGQGHLAHVRANVVGRHNVQNLLAAIMAAKELGMSLEEIALACKNIQQKQAGITAQKGAHGITIIDSSYSANPDGVIADLDYLHVYENKKVVVMPCLIELGQKSADIHREIGKKMAQVCDLAVITTKDKFQELSEGFMGAGVGTHKILFCENPQEIFNTITTFCKEGDTVLIEGGRPKELIRLLNDK